MNLGSYGEAIAATYLESKGYKIVEKNFRCKLGEIDIIASQRDMLVFIEVKTRSSTAYGLPCEAVNKKKQLHLIRTAAFYLLKNHIGEIDQRMDVVEVLYREDHVYIRHLENAF
ncbi:YraN family protein [Clostridium aminobutyricum]|uniref:UPF0102 protein JYB65_01460 n=2 Tax=Clostridium aminobutyricum TaxID=33953 RepID=A0A939IHJ0_CLOAM|nr:YraN family protein [Clostridium aminobutyricum]MBN7772031.1 YraN family protein [Clostridium aminobutyricum]